MGSDSKKTNGALSRTDLFYFDPNDLTLVEDQKHPLYDERIKLPIDDSIVLSIMKYGILEPITVRKNGTDKKGNPIIEVIDGRQRTRCAREANRRLSESGGELHRIPAVVKRLDDATLFGVMVATNEGRTQDSPLIKARKMSRFIAMGRSEDDVAITFCCSKATVKNHLALLDLDETVQRAIEAGRVGVTIAKKLAALPREEQVEALLKILDANAHAIASSANPLAVADADAAPDLAHVPLDRHTEDPNVSASDARVPRKDGGRPSKEGAPKGDGEKKTSRAKAMKEAAEEAIKGRKGQARQRSVRTKAQIEAAREAITGSRSEASAAFDAALCWVLGMEGALEGLPHLAKRLEGIE